MEYLPWTRVDLEGIRMAFTTSLIALTEQMTTLATQGAVEVEDFLDWKIDVDRFFDVIGILEKTSWQFDNDNTYRRQDNVMMFTRGRRKIDMTPVLHFDTNSRGKKSSF
ncbi:hypothetical protein KIW84_045325 [Lathyrus oleraceus]|uniref:Uncharacterized protein n=1 Tax=Pisum sativum TaxID=3888 RepID=A0A9D4XIT1_PEA|nr:hypothetical protein KIW84_045325 [Pisum sativum]